MNKNLLLCLLGSIILTGCLYAENPIGNREQVSANSPFIGYWNNQRSRSSEDPDVLSVFASESPDYLIAITDKVKHELSDLDTLKKDNRPKSMDVYRVYLSNSTKAPQAPVVKHGFVSLQAIKEPMPEHYQLMKYELYEDGTLIIHHGDDQTFTKARRHELVGDKYNEENKTITLNSDELVPFMEEFNYFPIRAVYHQ